MSYSLSKLSSHAHQVVILIPQLCRPLNLEWLAYFEHIVQSLLSTCLFGVRSLIHTEPHTTQI